MTNLFTPTQESDKPAEKPTPIGDQPSEAPAKMPTEPTRVVKT